MPEPQRQPSHADVHWRIGGLWQKGGQPDQARAEYLEALKEDSHFGPANAALAKLPASAPPRS